MDPAPAGRFTLKDLPREYQLLIPPPKQFRDPSPVAVATSVISVATGSHELFPMDYIAERPLSQDCVPLSSHARTLQVSAGLNEGQKSIPASLKPGRYCLQDAVIPEEQAVGLISSKTTVESIFSSCNLDDDHRESEEYPPILLKYFTQGHRAGLSTADSKALQISSLLESCRKYSRCNLRLDYELACDEEEYQLLEDLERQEAEKVNFLPTSGNSTRTGHSEPFREPASLPPSAISAPGSSTTSYVPTTTDLEFSDEETEPEEPRKETPFRNSRSYIIRQAKKEEVKSESYPHNRKTSEHVDGTLLTVSTTRESSEESMHPRLQERHACTKQTNVVTVEAALSQVLSRPPMGPKSNQISIQTGHAIHYPIFAQTLDKVTRDHGVQTRLTFSSMTRLMSPPLSITTYTQTEFPRSESPNCFVPVTAKSENREIEIEKKVDADQVPISELTEAFGRSILESFGRKCLSMQNISDWNSSKFYFLTNSDENSYRREFSHAETMLYTVMCQDGFQQQSTMSKPETSVSLIDEPPSGLDAPVDSTFAICDDDDGEECGTQCSQCQYFEQSPISESRSCLSISPTLGTTSLQEQVPLVPVADAAAATESLYANLFPTSGSVSREPSVNSLNSSCSTASGYDADADDEFSSEDDENSAEEDGQGNYPDHPITVTGRSLPESDQESRTLPPPIVTVPSSSTNDPSSTLLAPPAFVSQVLPHLSGAVIKRILKRGKLKAIMSDFC